MNYFYNNTLRQHIAIFGSLFEGILLRHYDESNNLIKEIKVPISYSNKDKFIQMYMVRGNDPSNYGDNIEMTLPRLGFEISNFKYNPQQKLNRLHNFIGYINNTNINHYANSTIDSESSLEIETATHDPAVTVFTPVPYKINFKLYLMTAKEADSLQIIEQILPMFTPHVVQSIAYKIGDTVRYFDEAVNLEYIEKDVEFNQSFDKATKHLYTLSFSMDVKFFNIEKTEKLIKHIIFKLGLEGSDKTVESYEMAAAPMSDHIIVNLDKWYDNFYNYMYFDLTGDNDYQILDKYINE